MTTLRKILPGMVLLASLLFMGCAGQDTGKKENLPQVPWQAYFPTLATGEGESKPILLHFATSWNEGSQKMKRETYGNFDVARYLQKNFATGWVDTEQYPELAKKYNVNSLPTIWFLDSDGRTLTSVNGFLGPERMWLLLEFINTKAYETMSYEAWKDRRPRP